MSAYLKEYNCLQRDDEVRADNSFHFACYLLTACWQVMLRRVTSCQALGLISILDTLSFDGYMPISLGFKAGPGDQMLGCFLTCIEEEPAAKDLLSFSDIELLSLKQIVSSIRSQPKLPPLSRGTSEAFGQLVPAAFRGFAASLIKLSTEHKKLVCLGLLVISSKMSSHFGRTS